MSQHIWSTGDTFELIRLYEANTLLWDSTHWEYSNKEAKTEIIKSIAVNINVDPDEVIRKLHNLRCQLCQEIKRAKKQKKFKYDEVPASSWRYFPALKFLIPSVINRSKMRKLEREPNGTNTEEYINLDKIEERDEKKVPAKFLNSNCNEESRYSLRFLPKVLDEERNTMEYTNLDKIEERDEKVPVKYFNSNCNEESKYSLRFLPKAPDEERNTMEYKNLDEIEERHEKKIPAKFLNSSYNEELKHPLRFLPKIQDEDDRFGEYVALELHSLRSEASKRRLKSEIRKAICRIADLDDAELLIPTAPSDPLSLYSPSSSKYSHMCQITNVKSENV
ncbi:PREDICTED: uncharacterized protein LOC106747441 isoform X1 [Dinoponera quadriceps]|uniref:Uncharacterized protein LOC106747441 isoform X1 n=1 Tax=Dinoponera quadriceps TaxID=609295 RepID=A0A6P3XR94_DINQU|nr:PREDICTED: uncharacterized protein LOC106747441 isoform X1 [Dinoponera quadriceps]